MKYRTLGASGIKVPALGFGCMRLPMLAGRKNSKRRCAIDVAEAVRMMHYAFEHGVNYFDSAWGYHMGWSEPVLGKALAGMPRNRVMVTTKMPVWLAKKPADFKQLLSTQLRRLPHRLPRLLLSARAQLEVVRARAATRCARLPG